MAQDFKPFAIGGSKQAQAVKLAETIAEQDYGVADMRGGGAAGDKPKVRYKDQPQRGNWGQVNGTAISSDMLNSAVALGRDTRLRYGSTGLDTIAKMPDLIKASKARSMRIW